MTTGRRIHVLPDSVANQIAAGEVVERPASVVKELLENALDAHATSVDIAFEQGGKRRIRVADDGFGMGREDAIVALDRHATSKITRADDLHSVSSFGFRGEALPSIAAVSRLTLETSDGSDVGTRVRVNGGRIVDVADIARRRGTTVEVENLFLNAPARRKFLKAARAETRAATDAVSSLALANPSVAVRLTSDGRTLIDLPRDPDLASRVGRLWGDAIATTMIPVTGEDAGCHVRGIVQRPDAAQPGFRRALLFVGGRPFHDRRLLQAVDRGYRTTVGAGARPWLVLYIDVPHGEVDINVHPAKSEVRFRDQKAVERLVEEEVRRALAGEESAAALGLVPVPLMVRERRASAVGGSPAGEPNAEDGQMALFMAGADAALEGPTVSGSAGERIEAPRPRLWQLHSTYILAETRDGLLLIDQHSAHERVLFQELMTAFAAGGQTGQRLLFPLTIPLPPLEYGHVESLLGLLSRAGFEVEGFGGDTVIVQAVPDPHPYFDAERCFREMIGELTHGSELVRAAGNQHERIAMTFACKAAIKAGQRLAQREMQELIDRLFATDLPHHDVHGRPTVVRLTTAELERRFGRA